MNCGSGPLPNMFTIDTMLLMLLNIMKLSTPIYKITATILLVFCSDTFFLRHHDQYYYHGHNRKIGWCFQDAKTSTILHPARTLLDFSTQAVGDIIK